ncbi:neutral alpha-glucosidase AB precursor, putative [Entamoeba invadens IP1]|uniref:neutral alpha-glucosidase AB precursor, putative n=1 Tax=Entamoeba invadens IP1 TaxID=370355 RepID=UPI0002C3ED98|nr:neutral alpha-glucosidase AB precursor, putative [Entamoeba invadens IP1]ELP93855.1 neutral alpha-glucosidase AB precursor, putative [Entamoeba invadens IP1]|eukprot:XP_004260626.1 neutral alpha-glucosidase AB precursor, putative [Entamoeba invadens IP1]
MATALSVTRSNFRQCKDTAFCRRANDVALAQKFIVGPKIDQTKTSVTLHVTNAKDVSKFDLRIAGLKYGIFRMSMRHTEGGVMFTRYEPEIGLSVTESGLEEVSIKVIDSSNSIALENVYSDDSLSSHDHVSRLEIMKKTLDAKLTLDGSLILEIPGDKLRFETGGKGVDGEGEETYKSFTDKKPHGPSLVSITYKFPNSRHLYGIPDHATNVLLKNTDSTGYNEPYRLYNTDVFEFEVDTEMTLYGTVPIIYSLGSNTGAVFHNNPTETFVNVVNQETRFVSESGILDEYLLPGPTPMQQEKQFLHLTGVSPLVPKYSLAYHQCRWNYMSQNEAEEVIEKMDEANIPFDVLWLDIEHTDDKKYFTWKKSQFPDPAKLIDDLKKTERRLVTIVDPHIKTTSSYYVYKEAQDQKFLIKKSDGNSEYNGWCWCGNAAYVDFINPKARDWWATLYDFSKYQYSSPYLMIWIDMNEPSVFNGPETTMQKDNIHQDGENTFEHRDVHNIYGLSYQAATYKGLLERTKNVDRPFVLSRSFFAGSQKFGAVWTGDTDSTWEHLKMSVYMTLNLNLVGIIQSGGDVGGFFRNPDEELLVRWYQVGAFYPFFRAHAHLDTKRREPYLYEGETRRRLKESIERRYELIDFYYREYYLSRTEKTALMRPLFYNYPEDQNCDQVEDEFMIGKDLLVVGVVQSGASSVKRYLPQGIWYDYKTYEVSKSGFVDQKVDMDGIPVFVRGGAAIPIKERRRRSSELMKHDPTTLVFYADESGKAEGVLYNDDGLTFKENHIKSVIRMDKNGIKCEVVENVGGDQITNNLDVIKIVVVGAKQPQGLREGKRKLFFDEYRTQQMNGNGFVIRKPEVNIGKEWTIKFEEREL